MEDERIIQFFFNRSEMAIRKCTINMRGLRLPVFY